MDLNKNVVTAGVYVNVNGLFPFQVGPTKSGTTLGVVRLGGHREIVRLAGSVLHERHMRRQLFV